jgi:hypothetical protein
LQKRGVDCSTPQYKIDRLSHNLLDQLVEAFLNKFIPKARALKVLDRYILLISLQEIGRVKFLAEPAIDDALPIPFVGKLIEQGIREFQAIVVR